MDIIKNCEIHGSLTIKNVRLNRYSQKGKPYWRCAICRNQQARNRLNIKYIKSPKKHEKNKVPKSYLNKDHAYMLRHKFKLSVDDYLKILQKQNNLCAICHKPETQLTRKYKKNKALSVDHCHKTGKIRGLLCHQCNIGIGAFKDSISLLENAISYLFHESEDYDVYVNL